MLFKRSAERYSRTPEPVTPYQKAAQAWDERIGAARVQARNWRLMAFGCLALSAGLSAGLYWQSLQSHVTPYVVEIERSGEVRAVRPAIESYTPGDAQVAFVLARFISNVRSLSSDPIVLRKSWLEAYDHATGRAANFLNEFARESDPFKSVGTRNVSVEVTSVVRVSERSFQVKWRERHYERGSLAATTRWTAILTIAIRTPRDAETLRKNPLGLYVEALDWSRELNPGETP
ncbi:conjugal transfer protein TrbF [Parvibaculum sp.]|uniref:conjugal transfer protein TrbF n=1 Tax=Parvibaculum sp. TaxID=2024848 RepID=UPI002BD44462|nr:conjugal transfer protein TrbF [Parvibaculum sp.]HUD53263.1 conjugal transfer protein TrbF [Parvibaculum sp.]